MTMLATTPYFAENSECGMPPCRSTITYRAAPTGDNHLADSFRQQAVRAAVDLFPDGPKWNRQRLLPPWHYGAAQGGSGNPPRCGLIEPINQAISKYFWSKFATKARAFFSDNSSTAINFGFHFQRDYTVGPDGDISAGKQNMYLPPQAETPVSGHNRRVWPAIGRQRRLLSALR